MTSISVPLPWQSLIAGNLPVLAADLHRSWPGIAMSLETGADVLFADLELDGVTEADAAWTVAAYLAPVWPALLAGHGVALEVNAGGASWMWEPAAIAEHHHGGAGREAWLAAAVYTPAN